MERLLKCGEAAKLLNYLPGTICKWARLGLLPYTVGSDGYRRFRYQDLIAHSKSQNLLSVGEVAKKVRVSRETVKRWAESGKLNAHCRTSAGHRRYRAVDIEQLLRGYPANPGRSDLLTTGEVAKKTRLSHRAIRQYADTGKLPCIKLPGGHRRFHRNDVDRLFAEYPANLKRGSLLSTGEVAKVFGVSERSVRMWADNGKFPCILTPGGHRRFRKEDIDLFQAARFRRKTA